MNIYKRGRGSELGTTEKKIQQVAKGGLEPEIARLQRVQRADHSATLPPPMIVRIKLDRRLSIDYLHTLVLQETEKEAST